MAQGDPIMTSAIVNGTFFLQPGTEFNETLSGFDTGIRSWLTHPSTERTHDDYPQINDADVSFPFMRVASVTDTREDNKMRLIVATYRGAMRMNGTVPVKARHNIPSVMTQMVSLPALSSGFRDDNGDLVRDKTTLVAPVPMPALTSVFLTATQPTYQGVGLPSNESFLPPPGAFNISYLPDRDQPMPLNYYAGWVLMTRHWDDITPGIWEVEETYQYFYGIAV